MSSEITHAGLPAGTLAVAPNWRREVRDTLILTLPIAAALLAEMGMGVIDYSMSGHLDPLKHPGALAAAGLGLQWLFTPMFWGMGVITATGAIGAQAHGSQKPEAVSESMRQGFLMATLLSIPIMAIAAAGLVLLPMVNGDPEVVRRVREIVFWGLPWIPLVYWFTVVRNFVTVMQRPMIVSICAVAGLPVSFVSNYVFMYGNWGAPEMGVSAVGLTGVIVAAAASRDHRRLCAVRAGVAALSHLRSAASFRPQDDDGAVSGRDSDRDGVPVRDRPVFHHHGPDGSAIDRGADRAQCGSECLRGDVHDSLRAVASRDRARRLRGWRRAAGGGASRGLCRGLARHGMDDAGGRHHADRARLS